MPQHRKDLRILAIILGLLVMAGESFWALMGTGFMGTPKSWCDACFLYAGLLTIPAFFLFLAGFRPARWVGGALAATGAILADIGLTVANLRETPDAPLPTKVALPFLQLAIPQILAPLIMAALMFSPNPTAAIKETEPCASSS